MASAAQPLEIGKTETRPGWAHGNLPLHPPAQSISTDLIVPAPPLGANHFYLRSSRTGGAR